MSSGETGQAGALAYANARLVRCIMVTYIMHRI